MVPIAVTVQTQTWMTLHCDCYWDHSHCTQAVLWQLQGQNFSLSFKTLQGSPLVSADGVISLHVIYIIHLRFAGVLQVHVHAITGTSVDR